MDCAREHLYHALEAHARNPSLDTRQQLDHCLRELKASESDAHVVAAEFQLSVNDVLAAWGEGDTPATRGWTITFQE